MSQLRKESETSVEDPLALNRESAVVTGTAQDVAPELEAIETRAAQVADAWAATNSCLSTTLGRGTIDPTCEGCDCDAYSGRGTIDPTCDA